MSGCAVPEAAPHIRPIRFKKRSLGVAKRNSSLNLTGLGPGGLAGLDGTSSLLCRLEDGRSTVSFSFRLSVDCHALEGD